MEEEGGTLEDEREGEEEKGEREKKEKGMS